MMQENKKVLIVDDEPELREIIEFDFDSAGYEVFTAENGKEALAILKKEKVDVLISDIVMPEMNGIQLVQEVRKVSEKPIFIFITGFSEYEVADLMDMGANCLIKKPFKRRALVTLSDELIKSPADRWAGYAKVDKSTAKTLSMPLPIYKDCITNKKFHMGVGGFFLATDETYSINQLLDFDFQFVGQSFVGIGMVRWARDKGIGVEILALKDPASYKLYQAFLKSSPTFSYIPKI